MRHFLDLLARFRKDEGGAFAMIFAVMAISIIAMAGAAVDFTSLQQARTKAQVALDAASLALQPSIYTTASSVIQQEAQKLLSNQLATSGMTWNACTGSNNPPCATVISPIISTPDGQLTLTANLQVPMNFVSLVGVSKIPAQIVSVATRKKLNLEVAMVLDNSGSMDYTMGYNSNIGGSLPTRMATLKCAAISATYILFYGVAGCDSVAAAAIGGKTADANTKIAIVPFSEAVNVGSANATSTWIDTIGSGNISDNNFDSNDDDNNGTTAATVDTFTGPVNRVTLMAGISGSGGWAGCVEARKSPYDTNDTPPNSNSPDTLFTPYFAPDEPGGAASGASSSTGQTFYNSYISDTPPACNQTGTCSVATPYQQINVGTTTEMDTTVTAVTTTTKGGKTTTTTTTTGPTVNPGYPQTSSTTTMNSAGSAVATVTTALGASRTASNICTCSGQTILSNTSSPTGSTTSSTTVSGPTTTSSNTVKSGSTTTTTTITSTTTTVTQTTPISNAVTCMAPYAPWPAYVQSSGGLSNRELQERICKYNGAVMTYSPNRSNVYGPNGDCPATPIQPLSPTPATVVAAINLMSPIGGTNITEGAAWGMRVLSPGLPFDQGRPYDTATSKVLIIMTDGENTIYPSSNMNDAQYYSAYGFPWNNRLGVVSTSDTTLEAVMNSRLSTVCTNAKNLGMSVYTIGVDTADTTSPAATKTLLTNCASVPQNAYFPNTAADLTSAFRSIASQLAALRIAQ